MVKLEVNEPTAAVINMIKSGERTPQQFIEKKDSLKKQGVDVDLITRRLTEKGLLKPSKFPEGDILYQSVAPLFGPIAFYPPVAKKSKEMIRGAFKTAGPTIGGIALGTAGALIGGPPGGIAGSTAGGMAGEILRARAAGEDVSPSRVGMEAAMSAGGELLGLGIAKGASKLVRPISEVFGMTTGVGGETIERAIRRTPQVLSRTNVDDQLAKQQLGKISVQALKGKKALQQKAIRKVGEVVKKLKGMGGNFDRPEANAIIRQAKQNIVDLSQKKSTTLGGRDLRRITNILDDLGKKKLTYADAHDLKRAADDLINWKSGDFGKPSKAAERILRDIRGQLNDVLRTRIPKYASVNDSFSELAELSNRLGRSFETEKGFETALKRFDTLPEETKGLLQELDLKLPKNKRFMTDLMDLLAGKQMARPFRKGGGVVATGAVAASPMLNSVIQAFGVPGVVDPRLAAILALTTSPRAVSGGIKAAKTIKNVPAVGRTIMQSGVRGIGALMKQ